jgi:anaerobic selenocysteine-containing dehydrogenase
MLLWGRAPEQSWPTEWYLIRKIKEGGGKLIVVDPRRTREASMADLHLQLRPGTDCALILSMINVIINEGLYDKAFVEKWCYGFEPLKERIQQYSPEEMAGITWISAEQIREAARMYATYKPATISAGMGVEHLENNAEVLHARYILPALTGNINVEGGEIITGPHPNLINEREIELTDMLPEEQRRKQLGADRFKLFTFPGFQFLEDNTKRPWGRRGGLQFARCNAHAHLVYNAIITGEPYPVKALINTDHNPIITHGNAKLVYKAYRKVDLHVVFDTFMTPSAELADYVLPAACWLEKPHMLNGVGNLNSILCGERALPPSIPGEYDHRDEYDFWRELGIRLGQEKYWPWKNIEEVYDYRLQPLGYTFEQFMREKGGVDFPPVELKRYEETGFGTPTGKIELYSTVLEKFGYDPLPKYREPSESPISQPELARKYPYILITGGRHKPFYHSEHRQIDSLRKRHPYPIAQINPKTAKEIGVADGDWVWIETPRGKIRQKCQYFTGINKQVIHAEHGWWFPELPGEEPWLHGVWESNINVCGTDEPDRCNPVLGSWPLKTFLCKVYKVKEYK